MKVCFIYFFLCVYLSLSLEAHAAWGGWGSSSEQQHEKVLLSDVKVLTLHRGEYTTGRRTSPVPQLKCIGPACNKFEHEIDTVQCYNMGSDGHDVQWKCQADISNDVKFYKLDVSCEGYDYPNDPYVLRGSCGLEYKLDFTKQHSSRPQYMPNGYQHTHHTHAHDDHSSSFSIGKLLMFGVVVFIFYNVYKQCVVGQAPSGGGGYNAGGTHGGSWGPGGGPGGGGGGGGPYGGSFPNNNNCQPPSSSYPSNTGGWRPGFWSGLAAGGMLGNMFNRGHRSSFWGGPRYGGGGFGGGGFGGGLGGGFGGGLGGGGGGGGSRSASGFGGTRRR